MENNKKHMTFRDCSKRDYGKTYEGDPNKLPFTPEQINTGCWQRIADAAEKASLAMNKIANDVVSTKLENERLKKDLKNKETTITRLKNQVTKLTKTTDGKQ